MWWVSFNLYDFSIHLNLVCLKKESILRILSGLRTRGRIEEDVAASVDDILDRNLEEMSAGLSRLKVLATGLNDELDEHDEILNRMDDKTGKVDWRVKKQNQTMTKLLKWTPDVLLEHKDAVFWPTVSVEMKNLFI